MITPSAVSEPALKSVFTVLCGKCQVDLHFFSFTINKEYTDLIAYLQKVFMCLSVFDRKMTTAGCTSHCWLTKGRQQITSMRTSWM